MASRGGRDARLVFEDLARLANGLALVFGAAARERTEALARQGASLAANNRDVLAQLQRVAASAAPQRHGRSTRLRPGPEVPTNVSGSSTVVQASLDGVAQADTSGHDTSHARSAAASKAASQATAAASPQSPQRASIPPLQSHSRPSHHPRSATPAASPAASPSSQTPRDSPFPAPPDEQSSGAPGGAQRDVPRVEERYASALMESATNLRKSTFKPRERRVPSSPIERVVGFGGLAARVAIGTAADALRSMLPSSVAGFDSPANDGSASPAAAQMAPNRGPENGSAQTRASASDTSTIDGSRVLLGGVLSEANAERLAAGLCRMRGAALKVGQMLSIQDESVVPPQLQAILQRVRDGADVMPQSQLLRVLREELGADWRSRMKEFDNVPIAAASIGQVHRVVSLDGRAGAMKVQYPGVARSIKSDISNLKRLVQLMDFLPRGLFIDESMKAAEEELTLECDYEHEARSQMRYKRLIGDEPGVHVPAVISELSTKRIITTEMVQGLPLDRLDAPELSQAVRNSVAARLLRICLRELFEFRFMQTDPNWSNFLYNPATDTIHLIDFGASREFSKSFVTQYLKMVHACAQRDRQTVIDTGVAMGFLTGDESQSMLDAHVEAAFIVGEPFASADAYDFHTGRIAERVGKLAAVMVKGRLTPPPRDSYTLHRKLSGAFLSCSKLKARIPCRDVFMEFYDKSVAGGVAP